MKRLVSATRATTPASVSGQQHPLIQLLLTCTLFQGHRSFSDVNSQVVVVYCSVIFPIDFAERRPEVSFVFPCQSCQWFRISAPFTSCSLSSSFGPFCPPPLLFFFFFSLVNKKKNSEHKCNNGVLFQTKSIKQTTGFFTSSEPCWFYNSNDNNPDMRLL